MSYRILHMLQWPLKHIIKELDEIKNQGFNTIQISPMQGMKENNITWWLVYQPTNFKVGNQIIGTKEDLIELCNEARKRDIKIIVDIVLRHVANTADDWLKPNECIDNELKRSDFYCEKRNINDYNNCSRWEEINLCTALPMLNYYNHDLQNIYIRYLDELIECGVHGFRIDMAKHFALPEDNGCDFYPRVFGKYTNNFIYGELINVNNDLIDKYSRYIHPLTNNKEIHKDKIIVYVESHDDYLEFKSTCWMNSDQLIDNYKKLTQNYPNTIFYTRPFDNTWKRKEIKKGNYNY